MVFTVLTRSAWSYETETETSNPFDDDRQSCLACIEKSWTDMRPKSLADVMAADEAAS